MSFRENKRRLRQTTGSEPEWIPLQRVGVPGVPEAVIEAAVKDPRNAGKTPQQIIDEIDAYNESSEIWVNDVYQVQVRRNIDEGSAHINIRRRDGEPIFRDWRHFQRIKDEVIGPDCEAVELYPAQDRLVDESNKYHLFASLDPSFRFPFGMTERAVSDVSGSRPGLKQRPGAVAASEPYWSPPAESADEV